MIRRTATSLFFGAALAFSSIAPMPVQARTQCAKVEKRDIAQLFDRWNQSLQTGSPDEVVKNYAKNGVLLPTVSNQVRRNHDEIKDYFVQFLKLKPMGKINQQNIRTFCNIAIDSGIYTFTVTNNNQPAEVQARYTFVYEKVGNKWLITEHHSSAMPETTNTSAQ
jgi:uncharacterized protein (TIGR02246 family)